MSDEYFASIPQCNGDLIIESISTAAGMLSVEIVPTSIGGSLLLRWRGLPSRTEWPEDVAISFVPDGMFAVFHSATADQRQNLINSLESLISQVICSRVKFDEV